MLNDSSAFKDMVQKFDQLSGEFDQRRENYRIQHPEMTPDGGTAAENRQNWEADVEMEQNMRLVADMQVALQKEIRSVTVVRGRATFGHNTKDVYHLLQLEV